MVSPIIFTYTIVECEGLLDTSNDTLLFGHISDPQQVEVLRRGGRELRRFVVIDEVVNDLYGSQVCAYLDSWRVTYKILPLPTTEQNKRIELVCKILEEVHR